MDGPKLALPNRRPPLVEEDGGGGFWICDAVGARDWRIEYVRCMVTTVVGDGDMDEEEWTGKRLWLKDLIKRRGEMVDCERRGEGWRYGNEEIVWDR